MSESYREESDSMGIVKIPSSMYYGAQTQRAVDNFPISDEKMPIEFIRAVVRIKKAAAKVNADLGLIDRTKANAIIVACNEILEGKFDNHFPISVYQTGSGTSTNMNVNEVIANRASEILGAKLGSKLVHPNDDVNKCQSSNDVIPTAIHVASIEAIEYKLKPALNELSESLRQKSQELWDVIKTGRTHLQDATPIRMGQVFLGYYGQIERGIQRCNKAIQALSEVALGGTAVGTGTNAHPDFARLVCEQLSQDLKVEIKETTNHFQAQSTLDAVVEASGVLRTVAVSLYKIANDIRWMASGPVAGLAELTIPEVQPGSSIMPGKVNPVICESVTMASAQVMSNDYSVILCGQSGSIFELNLMLPLAAKAILSSIRLMTDSSINLKRKCIDGIEATSKGPEMVEKGFMLVTALAPVIGYDKAAEIAKYAKANGLTVRQAALKLTSIPEDELNWLLDPARMTEPGIESG